MNEALQPETTALDSVGQGPLHVVHAHGDSQGHVINNYTSGLDLAVPKDPARPEDLLTRPHYRPDTQYALLPSQLDRFDRVEELLASNLQNPTFHKKIIEWVSEASGFRVDFDQLLDQQGLVNRFRLKSLLDGSIPQNEKHVCRTILTLLDPEQGKKHLQALALVFSEDTLDWNNPGIRFKNNVWNYYEALIKGRAFSFEDGGRFDVWKQSHSSKFVVNSQGCSIPVYMQGDIVGAVIGHSGHVYIADNRDCVHLDNVPENTIADMYMGLLSNAQKKECQRKNKDRSEHLQKEAVEALIEQIEDVMSRSSRQHKLSEDGLKQSCQSSIFCILPGGKK